jgi:hypothetical protein
MVFARIDHVPVRFVLDIESLHEIEYTTIRKIMQGKPLSPVAKARGLRGEALGQSG